MKIPLGYLLIKQEEYDKLKEDNRVLLEKVAQLSKTSATSSKPPSIDIVKQKPKKSQDKKRTIGGQPGHPKHERQAYRQDQIETTHPYHIAHCPTCKGSIDLDPQQQPRIIQQAEIVTVPIVIEQHESPAYWCANCQQHHYPNFPKEVVNAGFFKAKITALVAYMKQACHCSYSTIRKHFRDVLGLKVSSGYLSKIVAKVSQSLEPSYNQLLDLLPLAKGLNVDETGHKENRDKYWTWVFRADLYVLFKIDKLRSSKVLIDVLGKEFKGVLGCDYFSTYRKYMKDFNITIQFCLAHLIRDIKYLTTLPDAKTKLYGQALLSQVKSLFKIIHEKDELTETDFIDRLTQAKAQILQTALEQAPSHSTKKGQIERREVGNMVRRMTMHGKSYFEFITTPGMEPTNNVAEQAIRFIVMDRHITQGTRSIVGRRAAERLWTVIGTCAVQGKSAYEFILKSVEAYFLDQPSPSLIPDTG